MNIRQPRIHRRSLSLGATALAAALFTAAFAPHAFADGAALAKPAAGAAVATPKKTAKVSASAQAIDETLLKFSRDGQTAIDSVRLARIDLFDGKTDLAKQDLLSAQKALRSAKAEAPSFATTTQVKVQGKTIGADKDLVKTDVVPIDGDLIVKDDVLTAPQHQSVLAKARDFVHQGDKASAVKALKDSEIAVSYQRRWLAIPQAMTQVDQAVALVDQGKFYEANLALKALEDGITTDTVSFGAQPGAQPAS